MDSDLSPGLLEHFKPFRPFPLPAQGQALLRWNRVPQAVRTRRNFSKGLCSLVFKYFGVKLGCDMLFELALREALRNEIGGHMCDISSNVDGRGSWFPRPRVRSPLPAPAQRSE